MSLDLSTALTGEMGSLHRRPAARLTVERFLPEWSQLIAGSETVKYAHGHAAAVAKDAAGPGEDILFRARVMNGQLFIANIQGADFENPAYFESRFGSVSLTGLMEPAWTTNDGAAYGGSVATVAWNNAGTWTGRVFCISTTGDICYRDLHLITGGGLGSGVIEAAVSNLASAQIAACGPNEIFVLCQEQVEPAQAEWHKPIFGSYLRRYTWNGSAWVQDANPFLFHTHAEAHLIKDGPAYDASSEEQEAQWGFRPCGGLAVCELSDDLVLVAAAVRYFYRKAYQTHTASVVGFLYHRDNGVWERAFDNDEADYDLEQQLWVDAFVRGMEIDGRQVLSWVRLLEPVDTEQIAGGEHVPRLMEAVYARVSKDGRDVTQFQYLGDPEDLAAATIVAVNHAGVKTLYALGWQAVLQSEPAAFLCDVPEAQKFNLEISTSGYQVQRDNRWGMTVGCQLKRGRDRFAQPLLREGNLIRAYHGATTAENIELVQIGQGLIDTTAPAISLAERSHAGPLTARADIPLLSTRAELIEEILPLDTLSIRPDDPGTGGVPVGDSSRQADRLPAGLALYEGKWALRKPRWAEIFFPGQYDSLADRLVLRQEAFPFAVTGGGPVDLPVGTQGGPGDIADHDRKKRGTMFRDIVWTTLPPAQIDGTIQAVVRFGDDRNYGNFSFTALDDNYVRAELRRVNGLIREIGWFDAGGTEWNTVAQEAVMAGLICRSVLDSADKTGVGKKYAFVWEANSNFLESSHLEDTAFPIGGYSGHTVFDGPDYSAVTTGRDDGQGRLYLLLTDFDEASDNWQAEERWLHKAVAQSAATGLTAGRPGELKLQVYGGTAYCFYRPYPTTGQAKHRWRHAITYNMGHFGAGRFGLVARAHSGIQWDVLWPGRDHIDQTDNVVDFYDIEVADSQPDRTTEEIIRHFAYQGLTETEFRSLINDATGHVLDSGLHHNYALPIENPCFDFTVQISADAGEAGVFVRAIDGDNPGADCIYLGLVVNSTYKQADNTLNCYLVKRRYSGSGQVDVDYSPSPLHLKPGLPYRVRVSVRNELYSVWVEGCHVGHFKDDTELGPYFGLYSSGAQATFTHVRLPELHEVLENAILDPNQAMMEAIKKVIGQRHIKGVWRPYGKLLVSRFSWHNEGPTFRDSLVQNTYQQSDRFYSVVEVQGAYTRATYASPLLLPRGRRYTRIDNPDLMTQEHCYREAKLICQETAEQMEQTTFTGLPDLRLEPEDAAPIIVAQQDLNGTYLVDDIAILFDLAERKSLMQVSARQQVIL